VGVPYVLGTIYYNLLKGNKGIHVMEEDWDNLIVLDTRLWFTLQPSLSMRGNWSAVLLPFCCPTWQQPG